jgi:nitrite reductase/ring-hydroxylating ferredoxin subunit
MREPPPSRDLNPPLTRRRLLLVGAAVPLVSACGEVIDGAPTDASDGDAVAPDADVIAPDATPPDAALDAPPDAPQDVAAEPPGADVSPDRPDAAMDAPLDARLDTSADLAPDLSLADRADVPSEARDLGPDTVDVPVDMALPCGLSDRYAASMLVTAVPASGGVIDATLRVVVARDGGGLYAMSAVCPHNGCVVIVESGASTSCPCHGSTFDNNGVRTRGPATRSLIHHPLSVCAGRVYVDASRSTPVTTRTPPA